MTDVLRVRKWPEIVTKQWVRVKRGIYKDDIAQVDYIDPTQTQIRLKLLPRIDYTKKRDVLVDKSNTLKRKNVRPLAKPFNIDAIQAIGGQIKKNGDFYVFERNNYCHEGFVLYFRFCLYPLVHMKRFFNYC